MVRFDLFYEASEPDVQNEMITWLSENSVIHEIKYFNGIPIIDGIVIEEEFAPLFKIKFIHWIEGQYGF